MNGLSTTLPNILLYIKYSLLDTVPALFSVWPLNSEKRITARSIFRYFTVFYFKRILEMFGTKISETFQTGWDTNFVFFSLILWAHTRKYNRTKVFPKLRINTELHHTDFSLFLMDFFLSKYPIITEHPIIVSDCFPVTGRH